MLRRATPWALVAALTLALTTVSARQSLDAYAGLRSGWSWDLAYYNQWCWALARGDGLLSVRPGSDYGFEGPSVWKMNYLSPVRVFLLPVWWAAPGPETLLVVQCVAVWLCVPAAFGLVRSESGSTLLGLSAAAMVPLTPILWPLVWNDFRELQLALPFVLWAVQGVRSRRPGLAAWGLGGMLACRQEYALVVASLAALPARDPEDAGTTYRWARAAWWLGVGWMLAFFALLAWNEGVGGPEAYVRQFHRPRPGPAEVFATGRDLVLIGLGPWAVLACLSPRGAVLVVPWVVTLANGRWALRLIAGENWYHVRFAAPMAATGLAAGCLGYARLGRVLGGYPRGRWAWAGVGLVLGVEAITAGSEMAALCAGIPRPVARDEAAAVRRWVDRVGPAEGVVTAYQVAAPLSSRRRLYSYVTSTLLPPGYPRRIAPEIAWVFQHRNDLAPAVLTGQGFALVHQGPFFQVFRRPAGPPLPPRPPARSTFAGRPAPWPDRALLALYVTGPVVVRAAGWLAPALLLALRARSVVRAGIPLGHRPASSPGVTGAAIAGAVLSAAGDPVPLRPSVGPLADFFDARLRVLRLSPAVLDGRSLGDLATAALEAGQARLDPRLARLRPPLVFIGRLGSGAGWAVLSFALVFRQPALFAVGTALITAAVLAALGLVPIESAAARRARLALLGSPLLAADDARSVDALLDAARWRPLAGTVPAIP